MYVLFVWLLLYFTFVDKSIHSNLGTQISNKYTHGYHRQRSEAEDVVYFSFLFPKNACVIRWGLGLKSIPNDMISCWLLCQWLFHFRGICNAMQLVERSFISEYS